jgi:hypothetical protein
MYRMRNLILSMGVAVGIWTYHPCSAYIQSISQPRHRCYDPYTSQIDIQIAKPTEKQVEFTVYGVPEALARHRVNPRLEYAMYNPSAQSQKIFLKACIDELPETPYTGPLQVELNFYFGRPKVHFRSGKNSHLLKDDAPLWHTNRKGDKYISSEYATWMLLMLSLYE